MLLIVFMVYASATAAQTDTAIVKPLVIRGKLDNCPEQRLQIFFYDDHHVLSIDTIHLQTDGTFFLRTNKCRRPQQTSIQQNNIQINDIFVAPGYDLFITGDATNFQTLFLSTNIVGRGGASNRYRKLRNNWLLDNKPDTPWFELSKKSLVRFAEWEKHAVDSIVDVAFAGSLPDDDPYFQFFKRTARLDNIFRKLTYLLSHANVYQLSAIESEQLIADNVDTGIFKNLDNEAYLTSNYYTTWIVAGEHLKYLIRLEYLKDPALKNDALYALKRSSEVYSGKVRDLAMYRQMSNEVNSAKSIERLNELENAYRPYLSYYTDDFYARSLSDQFNAKADYLMKTDIGRPAPEFALKNENDQVFKLSDFKGRVVYMDLWASWCKPCREQTPFLEKLYARYKNDARVAFISIAVSDGRQAWLKALKQDKPTWLQLIDSEGQVSNAYRANLIPRFVIVNKKGEIVSFNAPQPSDKEALQAILEREMAF
jgi:thiol-disulfide isomerase/thioredoxin